LDFLDIPPIPFSDPALVTGAPHLSGADRHATAVPGDGGQSGSERGGAVHQGGEYELGWDAFAESAVDLAHLLAFCIRFLLLVKEGVGGWGHWTHGEVINDGNQRRREWAELGLPDTVVIRGDHDRIEVKDKRRGTVDVLGAAGNRHGAGRGKIHRG